MCKNNIYPYYDFDDEGNINEMIFYNDIEHKQVTNKFSDYNCFDSEKEWFKCKSCGILFDYNSSKIHINKLIRKKSRPLRLFLLNKGICINCSASIAKKIGRTKAKETLIKKWKDPEFRNRLIESKSGPNSFHWKGGIKYEPYCHLFNEEFKERVRNFWEHKCGICGKTEKENKRKLAVHHVNYDKKTCCNNNKPLFISLCNSCHSKTTYNRNYWENMLSTFIMIYFDGKSFFNK